MFFFFNVGGRGGGWWRGTRPLDAIPGITIAFLLISFDFLDERLDFFFFFLDSSCLISLLRPTCLGLDFFSPLNFFLFFNITLTRIFELFNNSNLSAF